MLLLRVFLLWALMLAVPFQGYAAAAMLQCPPGGLGASAVAEDTVSVAPADGHHGHDVHMAHGSLQDAEQDTHPHHDPLHKCGTCGACHAVALIGGPPSSVATLLPPADLAEPARALADHVLRVLDRPPRA